MSEPTPCTTVQRPPERKIRWWRYGGLLSLLIVAAIVLMGQAPPTRRIVEAPAEDVPRLVCSGHKEPRSLSCAFGLELWEEGKKADKIFQLWYLTCNAPAGHQASCDLERTLIVLWSEPIETVNAVSIHRHSTSDGSLIVRGLDWANWELSFDVVYPDHERMPVLLQLKPKAASEGFSLLEVKSFQAKEVMRPTFVSDALVSQEWRIPEYSYTLNVPIALLGSKSTNERERDDVKKKLGITDRQVFERIGDAGCLDFEAWFKQDPLRTLAAPYEAKSKELEKRMMEAKVGTRAFLELNAQHEVIVKGLYQKEEVKGVLRDKMRKCLAEAGMSKEGAELATSYLLRGVVRCACRGLDSDDFLALRHGR